MAEPPTLSNHPAADLFPMMDAGDLRMLADDIGTNGLLHPIVVFNGEILDGRNRLKACGLAGVKSRFVEWLPVGSVTPSTWVIATNLKRRHLTKSQCAAIAVDLLPMLEKEARERQGTRTDISQKIDGSPGRSDEKAGELLGVNRQYVSDAKKLKAESPELFEQVRAGTKNLSTVVRNAKREESRVNARETAELTGRFSVVLADPPWRYGATSVTGSAEQHYPTMDTEDICALAVREHVTDSAVLFLWATNPLLPDALRVIAAWGFTYRTGMVWVKNVATTGLGFYVRGKHEHLLIATRGQMLPETRAVSSVIESARMAHSRKPECVYSIVGTMYPDQKYLEMFARPPHREGWEVWGADS